MIYGYARVSTAGQNLKEQMAELKKAGVRPKDIYYEHYTGTRTNRPQFKALLKALKPNDTLVVAKLDRLARNTREALNVIHDLREDNITIKVLKPNMTVSGGIAGKIMYNTLLMVADIERDMIVERTQEGKRQAKAYAKAHNIHYQEGSPKRMLSKNRDFYIAVNEYKKTHSARETSEHFTKIGRPISARTVFRIEKELK